MAPIGIKKAPISAGIFLVGAEIVLMAIVMAQEGLEMRPVDYIFVAPPFSFSLRITRGVMDTFIGRLICHRLPSMHAYLLTCG